MKFFEIPDCLTYFAIGHAMFVIYFRVGTILYFVYFTDIRAHICSCITNIPLLFALAISPRCLGLLIMGFGVGSNPVEGEISAKFNLPNAGLLIQYYEVLLLVLIYS